MREGGCGQVSKNTVAKTIKFFTKNETSVKNGLSLDLKSNEMTKNGQNRYLWHSFLVLMVFYLGF